MYFASHAPACLCSQRVYSMHISTCFPPGCIAHITTVGGCLSKYCSSSVTNLAVG